MTTKLLPELSQAACFITHPPQPLQYGAKQRSCSSSRFLIMTTLGFGSNREQLQQKQSALRAIMTTGTKQHLHVDHQGEHRTRRQERPLPPEKVEIFRELDGWAKDNFLPFLRPVEKSWQPQDFLPDSSSEEFLDRTIELKERAAAIPDDYYVCLAGNLITEEALPTYQTVFNTFHGINDNTGASPTAWARWSRGWTAEENRHGNLLNTYLYLTGRLDMRQVEKTIQYLIGAGMDIRANQNAFCAFIYACFQERATFICHGNTARHAKQHGDLMLAKICGTIAADEKRHAAAYSMVLKKLFEVDPDEAMQSLAHMMRMRVMMPAYSMFDGRDPDLLSHFSAVEQRLGVYTARDYVDILEFFLKEWQVEAVRGGLSSEGRRAQEYVCSLPKTLMKLAERAEDRRAKEPSTISFSWIFNRPVAFL